MAFTRVIQSSAFNGIAAVNRDTGVLYVNPAIFNRLPKDQQDFVLIHEQGHVELQTASEYQANRYAVGKYIPIGTLTDSELQKRIQVVTEITNIKGNLSNFGIGDIVGSVLQVLPALGVGSKARQKEADAAARLAKAQGEAAAKATAAQTKMLVIGGAMLIIILVLFFTLKK